MTARTERNEVTLFVAATVGPESLVMYLEMVAGTALLALPIVSGEDRAAQGRPIFLVVAAAGEHVQATFCNCLRNRSRSSSGSIWKRRQKAR